MTGEIRVPAEETPDVDTTESAADTPVTEPADGEELESLRTQLEERTADLQRVTAEYANYRRRVDRDRQSIVDGAKSEVLRELLSVVDDIERAEQHGDLTGAFKAVADRLLGALNGIGVKPYGEVGDEFDPQIHEAVQLDTSPDVSGPTVTTVLRRGYRFEDRLLRLATVIVTDHEPAPGESPADGPPDEPESTTDSST